MGRLMGMERELPGTNSAKPVSLWEIERLLLGEIHGPEAEALRRKIAASPDLKAYLERAGKGPSRSFEDFQRYKKEKAVAEQAEAGSKRAGARPGSSVTSFRDWIVGFNRLLPAPRLAYGMAFAALMGIALWQYHPGQTASLAAGHRVKGGEEMELLLKVGGQEIEAGESLRVRAGDTLAFSYRSPKARHVSIWYREDGRDLVPFAGPGEETPAWSPATRWTPAPQRILLEGAWKRQEVWVVGSPRPLAAQEVESLIEDRNQAGGLGKAWVFRLVQETPSP